MNLAVPKRTAITRYWSQADWYALRQQGIGASDAPAALGLSPWMSQRTLWNLKTGRQPPAPDSWHQGQACPLYWGKQLDPLIAHHYHRMTWHSLRRVSAIFQHPDEDKAWMQSDLDRQVLDSDEVQLLECVAVGDPVAQLWQDGVPEYYLCQVQHQLAVTCKKAADIAVLLNGQTFKIHRIERDEDFIAQLIQQERLFWTWVETDQPPP